MNVYSLGKRRVCWHKEGLLSIIRLAFDVMALT